MFRLTNTGKLLLLILALLYAASITSQSGLLLLLIGIVGTCLLLNTVAAWKSVARIEILPPQLTDLSEGEKLAQPWRISNQSRSTAGLLEAISTAGTLFRVARLQPGETVNVVPALVFQRRGVFRHENLGVTSSHPFGLIKIKRGISVPGEVVVYPALYPVTAPAAAGYDAMVGGKHQGRRRTASGAQFAGVRPMQPGDPLKQIHWKSSAKGCGLMVKTFDEELSGRVAIVLDGGHSGDGKVMDDCVRAAGSLMFAALDEGQHVEWVDLARMEPVLVPPFDDGHDLLDALARLEMKPGGATEARLLEAVEGVSRKSALCLLATASHVALWQVAEELARRGRRVSVYLPAGVLPPATSQSVTVFAYTHNEIMPGITS
ncbi:MAG: DUF58 domain-containing protein [Verrucomicrobiota bacterium]